MEPTSTLVTTASHGGTLWQYLGSFILYTLIAIGIIYLAYWYVRKASGGLPGLGKRHGQAGNQLRIESSLTLEARKNLYIVRSGEERFLVATSMEGTQFLSRLSAEENATDRVDASDCLAKNQAPVSGIIPSLEESAPSEAEAINPSLREPAVSVMPPRSDLFSSAPRGGFGERLVYSIRWLIASRLRLI